MASEMLAHEIGALVYINSMIPHRSIELSYEKSKGAEPSIGLCTSMYSAVLDSAHTSLIYCSSDSEGTFSSGN